MNPSDEIDNEMLTAYFDGELSQAEQVQVEQSLFGCPVGRRQLRQWALLRQELQQWAEASSDGERAAGTVAGLNDPGRLGAAGPTSVVMQRVLAAFRDGSATWAVDSGSAGSGSAGSGSAGSGSAGSGSAGSGSAGSGSAGSGSGGSGAMVSGVDGLVAGVGGGTAAGEVRTGGSMALPVVPRSGELDGSTNGRGTSPRGGRTWSKAGWWSDYRRLTPRQRMRRWTWQLGSALTVAAALLLTVWLNPWSASRIEMAQVPAVGPFAGAVDETAPEAMVRSEEWPSAMGLEAGGMLAADMSLANASTTEQSLESYTAFFVYDAKDQDVSLEVLQTVLAANSLALTEIFHEDGNPAVVLSGDTRQLAEVMEAFQTQGEHQLAFVSKIDNAADMAVGEVAESELAFDAPVRSGRFGQAPMAAASAGRVPPAAMGDPAAPGAVADAAVADAAAADAAVADAAVAAIIEGPLPDGALAMRAQSKVESSDGGEVVAEEMVSSLGAERPATVLHSQFRQDIIRSQANLLANSMAPPANLTLEEFLRQRPRERQPRIPFDQSGAVDSEGLDQEQLASRPTESLEVAPAQRSREGLLGSRGADVQRVQVPGYLGQAKAMPLRSGAEAEIAARVGSNPGNLSAREPSAFRPDVAVSSERESSSNTQIVVIIRGKKPSTPSGGEATQSTGPARGPQD